MFCNVYKEETVLFCMGLALARIYEGGVSEVQFPMRGNGATFSMFTMFAMFTMVITFAMFAMFTMLAMFE